MVPIQKCGTLTVLPKVPLDYGTEERPGLAAILLRYRKQRSLAWLLQTPETLRSKLPDIGLPVNPDPVATAPS